MKRKIDDAAVRSFRDAGLRVGEIARRIGVTPSAVSKALSREMYRAKCRRDNEARRARIRAWEREQERPCVDCCAPVKSSYVGAVRCLSCSRQRTISRGRERTERMLNMRKSGWTNAQIAAAEGVTPQSVASQLQRSRVARYGFEWVRAPYPKRVGK